MINEFMAEDSTTKLFVESNNGIFQEFDVSLPLQMLFDDVITFVSKTDFE